MKLHLVLLHFLKENLLLFLLSRSPTALGLSLALFVSCCGSFYFGVDKSYPLVMIIPYSVMGLLAMGFLLGLMLEKRLSEAQTKEAHAILQERGMAFLPGEIDSLTVHMICSTWARKEKSNYEQGVLIMRTPPASSEVKPIKRRL